MRRFLLTWSRRVALGGYLLLLAAFLLLWVRSYGRWDGVGRQREMLEFLPGEALVVITRERRLISMDGCIGFYEHVIWTEPRGKPTGSPEGYQAYIRDKLASVVTDWKLGQQRADLDPGFTPWDLYTPRWMPLSYRRDVWDGGSKTVVGVADWSLAMLLGSPLMIGGLRFASRVYGRHRPKKGAFPVLSAK